MRRWWRHTGVEGVHADPDLERESARLIGKLDAACDQLAGLVSDVNDATGELDVGDIRDQARRQEP